jgi:endonuclease/exonuclease/phosphatase family metal-dependent hydrolase
MGFAYKNHTADSPNRIIEYIADSGADIVCIQEYSVSKGGGNLTAKRLNRALKMYPFRSVIELNSNKYQSIGIALFSKYPIEHSRRIKYKSAFNGSAIHEINIKGKKITLVNNHLESFKLTMEDRSKYSQIIGNLGSEALVELKGTLQQKLGTAFQIRAGQAESVAKEVKEANGEYVLVCGDFNDTPISYAHRTIQGDLIDAFSESGRGLGISYNQNKFWFRIDNILHSSNIKSYRCTVDKVRYSDHYPMWCYITLE